MISIVIAMRSFWACKILNGEKSIEVRKGLALYNVLKKAEERGEEVEFLMYVTKGKPHLFAPDGYNEHWWTQRLYNGVTPYNGAVVARFKATWFEEIECIEVSDSYFYYRTDFTDEFGLLDASCLDEHQLHDYLQYKQGTALYIEDSEIFDKPKTLADYGLKRAPQSWCYAEEI